MSTRSMIGIELKDKSIKAVYCHFDGYPEGVGKTLLKYYTHYPKVKELIELGPISALGYSTNYADNSEQGTKDYHRWRNEKKQWKTFTNKQHYLKDTLNHNLEVFSYLFTLNNQWLISDAYNPNQYQWHPLNEFI